MSEENIKKAVEKFYEIRNLPYHISVDGEPAYCCEGKAKLLSKQLEPLGYKAFLRAGLFRWSDLKLPKSLTSIEHENDCTHWFLEVKNLDGDSIFVDTTWNLELKEAGFQISEWDGVGSTNLAVPCYKIFSHKETEEHLKVVKYPDDEFYKAFNKYCNSFLKKVEIFGVQYSILAIGKYVTESDPDKPYKKYKLSDSKVLVVSEKEDSAYFGEDFGDLGIEPGSKTINYKDKEFQLSISDQQILKETIFGKPEGNVDFWDYENGGEIISIGITESGERKDVIGIVIDKGKIEC